MTYPAMEAMKHGCPTCGAKPGDECRTSSGKPVPGWRLTEVNGNKTRFPGIHAPRMSMR